MVDTMQLSPGALLRESLNRTGHMERLDAEQRARAGDPASMRDLERATLVSGASRFERLNSWGRSSHDYSKLTPKGYLAYLAWVLEDVLGEGWAPSVAIMIPSNQEQEHHKWLGQIPQFRKWIGARQAKGMPVYAIDINNDVYEDTLDFDVEDFRYDKSGQILMRIGEFGKRARAHWEKILTSDVIVANPKSFDGTAFFGTSHVFVAGGTTMKNDLDKTILSQLAVTDPSKPTTQECVDIMLAIASYFYTYVDNQAEPINGDARKFAVMVPPHLWARFHAATQVERLNFGQDNTLKVQDFNFRAIPNPRLDDTAHVIYVFREDSLMRPFIAQDVNGVETQFLGAGSEVAFRENKYLFGAKAVRGVGPGAWFHAIRATLSS